MPQTYPALQYFVFTPNAGHKLINQNMESTKALWGALQAHKALQTRNMKFSMPLWVCGGVWVVYWWAEDTGRGGCIAAIMQKAT